MDLPESFLNDHLIKCRCCFKHFSDDNQQVRISRLVESRFFEVTQIELKMSRTKKYSEFICQLCDNDLEGFVQFRNDAIQKQKILYEVIDGVKERPKRKRAEVLYAEDPEDLPVIKIEPKEENEAIQIKECSIVIEPLEPCVKTEVVDVMEQLPDFPDHLYDSDDGREDDFKVEPEDNSRSPNHHFNGSSSSSEDLVDEIFKALPKPKKPKSKYAKKKKLIKIQCPQCPKWFVEQKNLDHHINKVHLNIKSYTCDFCDFKSHHKTSIYKHVKSFHDREPKEIKEKQQCPICGVFIVDVKSHMHQNHAPKKFSCDICGYRIYSKNRMRRHVFRHLSKDTKHETEGITCEICGVNLLSRQSLRSHMKNKHMGNDEKKWICHCGKAYKMEAGLKLHQKTAHRPEELKNKFVCRICNKGFLHKQSLKDHILLHQRGPKKEHACHQCGKLYPSEGLLSKHMIFHTAPTFPCPYPECGKLYHRPCFVRRHIKHQHEVVLSDCEFCGKSLNIISMTKHVREFHSGLEKQPCVVPGCGSTYIRRHHMEDHIKRMHREFTNTLTPEGKEALQEQIRSLKLI